MTAPGEVARTPGPDPWAGLHPDRLPGPVVRLDLLGRVQAANAAARRLLGEDLPDRSWAEVWPDLPAGSWEGLIERGEAFHHEGVQGDLALSFTVSHEPGSDAVFVYGADVTELHRAQLELARQAEELRENALFPEMNPGPVCRLDLDAVVLRANRAAVTAFGDALLGTCWREVVAGVDDLTWHAVVHEGVRHWVEAEVDGTTLGFTMARAPGSAYVYVYGADVGALKAAERKLAEMALFPEMNPGPVVRLERGGTVVLANRAARELFGGAPLVGRSWVEICPGMTSDLLARAFAGEEGLGHETQVDGRSILFTHTPGVPGEQLFVYGADLTDLKVAERALRQSERMATLGTLAAGVAHELNNPAAAVQRASEHLQKTFGLFQEATLALQRLALDRLLLDALTELDRVARERAQAPPDFDPLVRSDREYDVELWLEDQEVEDGWELAPALVSLGYGPAELDDLADEVDAAHLRPAIVWMSRAYPVYAVLEEIRHGATRISEIVTALKAYSYVGQAPVQAVDVNEGIRHTLIILRSKLKHGITVELELAPGLPRIEAYGGELNQVWTNLIDNAADAVEGSGRLVLRTAAEDGGVRVEVEDDGPGIPEAIQGRVFDPFFTTKEPGRGTGLGLNTTYNTVRKHGGRIELDSRPGRTRFVIRLPSELPAGARVAAPDPEPRAG